MYDIWGHGVNTAYVLAQLADPEAIVVSGRTKSMLPNDVDVERLDAADHQGWRVVSSAAEGELSR